VQFKISDLDQISTTPRHFERVSVTTPVVSTLKHRFWIQVAVSLVKSPHGGFKNEVKRLQIYNGYVSELNSRHTRPRRALESGTEVMPVKDFRTRIKPLALALASGHGRYMAVTPERAIFRWGMAVTHSRYKFVTVSLPKQLLCNGSFASGTATRTARRFQN
jgi:hypothetical protein